MIKLKKTSLIIFIIIFSFICNYSFQANCEATQGTIVNKDIRRDTIWTQKNSPYILKDDISIKPGVTLKIQKGVVIDFSLWSLLVEGELHAKASADEHIEFHFTVMPLTGYKKSRIIFTEESQPVRENSIRSEFDYVDIYCKENTVKYGLIEGGTLKLNHLTIHDSEPYSKYYTLNINGSIINSKFERVTRAIKMGEGEISNNQFINSSSSVINIGEGTVTNNIIDGGTRGITVKNALVQNNSILNIDSRGIFIHNFPTSTSDIPRPIIKYNLLAKNSEHAIYISGETRPRIIQNMLINNNNGLFFDEDSLYEVSRPRIYENIFYMNENNVYFSSEDPRLTTNMQDNWWGTNDAKEIEDKIYYEYDDPRLTSIIYKPILSEIPSYLPKLPLTVYLQHPIHKAEVNNVFEIRGEVYPPLNNVGLLFRYIGPNEQFINRTVITDSEGNFRDEFSLNSSDIWILSVGVKEDFCYNAQNVNISLVVVDIEKTIIGSINETAFSDEYSLNENNHTLALSSVENSTDFSSNETDEYNSETIFDEFISGTQIQDTEQEQSVQFFGFIPSILTFVITVALFIAVNILKR